MVFHSSGICEEMILAHFGYTMYCLGFGYAMYCLGPLVIQCTA